MVHKKIIREKEIPMRIRRHVPKWFYFTAVLIPILFFLLLEAALRIFNYGSEIKQWVNVTEDKYMLNPEVARRYFYSTKNVPYSNQNTFDVIKKESAFRIFILGESSAAGYPYSPNGDFGHYLEKRLEIEFPGKKIEVVNLGLTATNSYTLRDLFPGVLDQKPDLIMIYTGHNEYYGALGVGSLESFGSYPFLVNTALYLNKFRTFQLIRNIIKDAAGLFSDSESSGAEGRTLMSQMARDKLIKYNSGIFNAGLHQYESNMTDILEMAKEAGVNVILGTVTFNLKDQAPFISAPTEGFPEAAEVFSDASFLLSKGKINQADSLFRLAKDLDALRFRAPEKLNSITRALAVRYNYPLADIDKEFNKASPDSIAGNNLMVDHLHPTLAGYLLIGKIFFKKMEEAGYLPQKEANNLKEEAEDSTALANFYFSKLDSVIADYRIILLKNDWPFVNQKARNTLNLLNVKNELDSIGLNVIVNRSSWEAGHRAAAAMYLKKKDYDKYLYELKVLIDQYPFITEYYDTGAENLLQAKEYDRAYDLLEMRYKYSPSAFSAKWLGIIDLSKNRVERAVKYLEESIQLNGNDAQVYFNLSGAYSMKKEYRKSLDAINQCLRINPEFPGAQNLQRQLSNLRNTDY